jgi:acyl-CoA thioesterase-1
MRLGIVTEPTAADDFDAALIGNEKVAAGGTTVVVFWLRHVRPSLSGRFLVRAAKRRFHYTTRPQAHLIRHSPLPTHVDRHPLATEVTVMYRYTTLGDSITAGEDATAPDRAYPGLMATLISRRGMAAYANVLAQPGWTSADLTAAVFSNPPAPLTQSRAVSIWIGGDDLAAAGLQMLRGAPQSVAITALKRYERDIALLVGHIRRVSQAKIVLCTQYNPFPHSPIAVTAVDGLNTATARLANTLHTALAPVHTWFAGREAELIAFYRSGRLEDALTSPRLPVHPNNLGHRVIAEHLLPFVSL